MTDGHIVLSDVHKSFGSVHAVRGVSLTIRQNEFVTLLGPSGCGKTTLLRIIGGLDSPDQGDVIVDGRSVDRTAPRDRRTRMVFQQYALFPHMTVGRNVEFGLRMRNMPRTEREKKVTTALAMVQLNDKVHSRPNQLSGGQQQRVALARAIVTEPSVLLLDEPLAALDLQLRKSMQLELKTLQRNLGITFIYVTHDQTEALTMSDRIVVMSNGKIEQVGSSRAIYDSPATSFVAQFIGDANYFQGKVSLANGERAEVSIANSVVSLPNPAGSRMATGDTVSFVIRPERMLVGSRPDREGRALACTVSQIVYLGAFTRVLMKTSTGQALSADIAGEMDFMTGQVVFVTWAESAVRWVS